MPDQASPPPSGSVLSSAKHRRTLSSKIGDRDPLCSAQCFVSSHHRKLQLFGDGRQKTPSFTFTLYSAQQVIGDWRVASDCVRDAARLAGRHSEARSARK